MQTKTSFILAAFILLISSPLLSTAEQISSSAPNFINTTWQITPGQNSQGARSSTVTFSKSGKGKAFFDQAPTTVFPVKWNQDNKNVNLTWFMVNSEGVDQGVGYSRAFRASWQADGSIVGGYSCVVKSFNLNFKCSKEFQDYNFSMAPTPKKN